MPGLKERFGSVALGLALSTVFALPAAAASLVPAKPAVQSNISSVRWVCDRYRNCWEEPDRRGCFSIEIGPGGVRVGPDVRRQERHRRGHDRRWNHRDDRRWQHRNAHVQWCLDRYRSYNPRTDTFTTYGGDQRRCRSPYS